MSQVNMERIRAVVSDVDGVLTNGAITVSEHGEIKSFNVRDGMAIRVWQLAGKEFALLTGRVSKPLSDRAAELKIGVIKAGRLDKQTAFEEILSELNLSAEETAYIGDDLPDLAPIAMAGVGFCPQDAVDEVRGAADVVVPVNGGGGVVRYVIETLLKAQGRWREVVAHYEVKRD